MSESAKFRVIGRRKATGLFFRSPGCLTIDERKKPGYLIFKVAWLFLYYCIFDVFFLDMLLLSTISCGSKQQINNILYSRAYFDDSILPRSKSKPQ